MREKRRKTSGLSIGITCLLILLLILFSFGTGTFVQAENDGSSAKAGVQTVTDIVDMKFTGTNTQGTPYNVSGNKITLSNGNTTVPYEGGGIGSASSAVSSLPVSLEHSWSLKGNMYCPLINFSNYDIYNLAGGVRIACGEVIGGLSTSKASTSQTVGRFQWCNSLSAGEKEFFGKDISFVFSFDKNKNKFTLELNSGEKSKTLGCPSPFNSTTDLTTTIYVSGNIGYHEDFAKPDMTTSVTFESLQYTDYAPQILSTKLLDSQDREITGKIGKGQTVTVQTTLKNQDNKQDDIPMLLKLSDQASGFTGITPLSGSGQQVKVDGNAATGDIINGIPCEVSPDGTTVEYKAKITGNAGTKIIIPHMAADEYFSRTDLPAPFSGNGKLYATREWTVNRDLVSDYDNKTKFDYSHTPYDKSSYGWYRDDLTLQFTPSSDFDEFYIDDAIVPGGRKTFTDNTSVKGQEIELYGRLTKDNSLSGITKETIRIDKIKPTITLDSRENRQMTLKDPDSNPSPSASAPRDEILCSGIAAVEMKAPGETKYKVIDNTFIPQGETSGLASTVFNYPAFTKSGTYAFRVMDAAGNYSDTYTITTQIPIIAASDLTMAYADQSSYTPAGSHKVTITDDETIELSHLEWTINKDKNATCPASFTEIKGGGTGGLPQGKRLPIGSYVVKFSLDTADQDGSQAKPKEVKLRVYSGDPPIINNPDNETVDPDKIITDAGTGTKHALATGSDTITIDTENPYKGGYMDMDDAKDEIISRFHFIPQITGDSLTPSMTIKQNGVDVTGIDTRKPGTYVISYKVTDSSGCSTAVDFTLKIIDNCTVTFHADRGEFKLDGALEKTTTVKVGKTLTKAQIPGKTDLAPPVYNLFKGWSTRPHDDRTVDVGSIAVKKDMVFYAVYEAEEAKYNGNITVTFFSADAATGRLTGEDGTRVRLSAEKGKTTALSPTRIPEISYSDGSSLRGWKTDETGSRLLTTEEVCKMKLRGGDKLTCIAYLDKPKSKPAPVKVIKEKEQTTKVITRKVPAKVQKNTATFIFYSSDKKQASIKGGDGTAVTFTVPSGGKAALTDFRMPQLNYKNTGIKEIHWKTSITGDRMLTGTELARLNVTAGSTVSCTAYFKTESAAVTKKSENTVNTNWSSSGYTQFLEDEKVPLGANPNSIGKNNSCSMHWYMVIWAVICLIYELWSLRKRKKAQEPQFTGSEDWIYITGALAGGLLLFILGSCYLDLYILLAGIIIIAAYTIRMKWLDHKEKNETEQTI